MALLGSFIDVRTVAGMASNATVTFAHGLPATPDFVLVNGTGAGTGVSNASMALPINAIDATNVSLFGTGLAGPALRITSVVAHSVIR